MKVNDRVAYSHKFLKSIGAFTEIEMAKAKGTITEIDYFGELALATIEWDTEDIPQRVNIKNLCKIRDDGFQLDLY